jgi:anti-anti-sigma factor
MESAVTTDSATVHVVAAPPQLDTANAREFGDQLRAAIVRCQIVVADLTGTRDCDLAGVGELSLALEQAGNFGHALRLVTSSEPVLRSLSLTGLDGQLPIFPSLAAALSEAPESLPS